MTLRHAAIIPVKRWGDAKRRLAVPSQIRGDLARAFAEDVVAAVRATPSIGRVVIVSSEPDALELADGPPVHLVRDPLDPSPDQLNAAILAGAAWAAGAGPREPVVVVPADLPCLTSDALEQALSVAVGHDRVVVPDATGLGTALLIASSALGLEPHYGHDSAARHRAAGCHELLDVDPRVRRDVDSLVDLAEAVLLGVGRATAAVLRRHPLDLTGQALTGELRARHGA